MSNIADTNQFSALQSPMDDGKSQEGLRTRFSKDDIKEQAYQAKEFVKTKAVDLKEQIAKEGVVPTLKSNLETVRGKVNEQVETVRGKVNEQVDTVRQKVGLNKEIDSQIDHSDDQAEGEWEEVKRRGTNKINKAAKVVDQKLDENLTKEQRAKLNKAGLKAKKGAIELEKRAEGWSNRLLNIGLSNPRLRPVKSFIQKNNLQLPVVILGSLLTLWLGLSLIRLLTSIATPSQPEFDIHSKSASTAWLKYHAGEYKGKAMDLKDSITDRAASFLSNTPDWDTVKDRAVDYRDIGMSKLGLQEPTWGQWAWAKLTGRPISWQDRVNHVVDLTKQGIYRPDILTKLGLRHPEPTLGDRLKASIPSFRAESHWYSPLLNTWETIREALPGGAELKAARLRAMAAAKPSTLDNIKSTATYVKNRIVHGAEEAAHIAQDRANEAADKAKYKAGL